MHGTGRDQRQTRHTCGCGRTGHADARRRNAQGRCRSGRSSGRWNRWRSQYAGGRGAGYPAGSTARADTPGGAGSAVSTVSGPGVTEAAGIAELIERVIECQVGFGTLPVAAHSEPGDLRDGLRKLTQGLGNLTQGLQHSAECPGDGAGDTGDQCGDLCRGAVQVRSGAFVVSAERPR